MRGAAIVLFAACSSSAHPRMSDIEGHERDQHGVPPALEPVIVTLAGTRACPLAWDQVAAPPEVTLSASIENEDCFESDDSTEVTATMHGDVVATAHIAGPSGSGHFVSVTLTTGQGTACINASTVGWRALGDAGASLAPLPWLADIDGDEEAELVIWDRLPWGDSEIQNALLPIVYVLDGDRLVRRDDRARALRRRVGQAYAKVASTDPCLASVAAAFGK